MVSILVVDDEPLIREAIALTLRGSKHGVLEASDGQAALGVLSREKVDLVISDIIMPEMDGIGLIVAIRKRYQDIRVICISGGDRTGGPDYLDMAPKLGAQMILPKPFTPRQLLASIEAVMSRADPPVATMNSHFHE